MPDFFDKLREQIDAGLTKVTTKSRVTLETTRLSGQIRKLTKEKEEALARLGAQVYQDISQTGQLNQQSIEAEISRIKELDRSLVEIQQEIARLEALDAATPWSAKEEEKPIAACTCGAPITEGTNFCGNCGTNTQEIVARAKAEQLARVEATKKTTAAVCPKCGTEVSATAKFCRNCGATLPERKETTVERQATPRCPHCGNEITPTARFCRSCGKSVRQESPSVKTEDTVQGEDLNESGQQGVETLPDSSPQELEKPN